MATSTTRTASAASGPSVTNCIPPSPNLSNTCRRASLRACQMFPPIRCMSCPACTPANHHVHHSAFSLRSCSGKPPAPRRLKQGRSPPNPEGKKGEIKSSEKLGASPYSGGQSPLAIARITAVKGSILKPAQSARIVRLFLAETVWFPSTWCLGTRHT